MYCLKTHQTGDDVLVACCDREILGERFSSDGVEIHIDERFYGDTAVDEREILKAMRDATTANLMGEKIVALAIKHGLIEEDGARTVCGVKHAQMYRL